MKTSAWIVPLLLSNLLVLSGCQTQASRPGDRQAQGGLAAGGSAESRQQSGETAPATRSESKPLLPRLPLSFASAKRLPSKTGSGKAGFLKVSVPAGVTGDYSNHPALARFIVRMESQGFSRQDLERLFSAVERQQWILDYMHRIAPRPSDGPSRPTGAWLRYRAKFLKESNLAAGTDFWRRHADTLERAERTYGVPAEYLVAILGVETRWGGYIGSHRIIDALATLAFEYPRRSAFFTDELAHYLVMARDEGFDPLRPIGSFAGAMGLGQFMPSSFHQYAVDFDHDGHRDLWDAEDAIGSVANYFVGYGWRAGQPVATRAPAGTNIPASLNNGFDSHYAPGQLTALGFDARAIATGQQRLSLLRLDIGTGYEYWVGFDNFYVITRYNHSTYYAMAVHQLARELRARIGASPRTLITEEVPPADARS